MRKLKARLERLETLARVGRRQRFVVYKAPSTASKAQRDLFLRQSVEDLDESDMVVCLTQFREPAAPLELVSITTTATGVEN